MLEVHRRDDFESTHSPFSLKVVPGTDSELVLDSENSAISPKMMPEAALARARSKLGRRTRIVLASVGLDVACIVGAIAISSYAILDRTAFSTFIRVSQFVVPLFLLLTLNANAHQIATIVDRSKSVRSVLRSIGLATACFMLSAFFWKSGHTYSRLVLGMSVSIAAVALTCGRLVLRGWAVRLLGDRPLASLCIYDGIPQSARASDCAFDARELGICPDRSDPRNIARLGQVTRGMARVIIHCRPEDRTAWAFMIKALDIPSEIAVPELTELAPLAIEHRAGQVSVVVARGALAWNQALMKRAFDLVVAGVALTLLAPLMIVIATIIRLESPGPALFRQDRIGLGNRKFRILKFRSMRSEMQDDKASKLTERNDPRVTRFGNFIRRTSLDELPQLFNVLKGEMSIVGPRPHAEMALAGKALYWEVDETYWHRHVVKPGMTGLAQVRGHRGNTFHEDQLKMRLQADLEYAADWSLWRDIKIVLQTAGVLFGKHTF